MSAETLRRAASLMRERAAGADADDHMWQQDVTPLLEVSDETYALAASWHPAVALKVADWLEKEATWADIGAANSPDDEALAVARAYLGGAS